MAAEGQLPAAALPSSCWRLQQLALAAEALALALAAEARVEAA